MLTLYYSPGSCSFASLIALHEAGAEFEARRMSLADGDQRKPEFLAVNPKGRVPVLSTEQGILTETPAILVYIAQTYPDANLIPKDAWNFGRMQAFNAYICSTVHVNHSHKQRGSRWADEPSSHEDMRRKVPETMAASMLMIEDEMFEGPWVMGEHYTVADPYLYTICTWLEGDGVDIANYPKLSDFVKRMQAREAVIKAQA